MARFYKTASVAPMDYMYQMNIPLMQQAIQANELGVNQQIERAQQVGDAAAKFAYLTPDAQRAAEITGQYNKQVDEIAKAIQQDPMNWRKQKNTIREAARNLQQNYQTGEISKIVGNYNKYKELDDYITKKEESGKLNPQEGAVFRAKALESLKSGTAYDPKTGVYQQVNAVKPMDTINIRERLQKYVDDIKKQENLEWDTETGQYFKKTTQGREWISPDRIISAAMSGAMGDTELQQYLKQRSDFGLMSGVYDKNGKFIAPYTTESYAPNEVEKAQITELQNQIAGLRKTNPQLAEQRQKMLDSQIQQLTSRQKYVGNRESSLFPVIQSLATEYSYDSQKRGVDVKNNSLYNLGVSQAFQGQQKALDRNQRESQFVQRMNQAKGFHDDTMALNWYKAMNNGKSPSTAKGGAKGAAATAASTVPPKETGVGANDVSPFSDDPFYTIGGLSSTIDQNKQFIDKTTGKIGTYQKQIDDVLRGRTYQQLSNTEKAKVDQLTVPMAALQEQMLNKSQQLDLARQWYSSSTEGALEAVDKTGAPKFNDREKELYRLGANQAYMDRLQSEVDNIKANKSSGSVSYTGPGMGSYQSGTRTNEDYGKMDLLNNINNIKKRVDNERQSYLDNARKESHWQVPAITFGDEDRKAIAQALQGKTAGLAIYDALGKINGGLGELDSKGISLNNSDNYKASFANGDIWTYLDKNGGELEYLSVSPSMGMGEGSTGATMKVRFKNTKNPESKSVGDLPTNKDFYVTLDPQTQMQIGEKYAVSKNPRVAELGKSLLDSRDQQIRNKLISVRADVGEGEWGLARKITVPTSGGELPILVREFHNQGGDWDYYITLKRADGSEVPMRSTSDVGDGWFSSIEQFTSDLNKNVQEGTLERSANIK